MQAWRFGMAAFIIIMALLATVLGQHGAQVPSCRESYRSVCMDHLRDSFCLKDQGLHNPIQLEVITFAPDPGAGGVPYAFVR